MPPDRNGAGAVRLTLVLATLMAFAPFAVDMYLPALPAIAGDLGASQAEVQWSLSAFFLGLGSGQLAWGPLGDRLGRRGPIIAGIVLFVGASVGCALAASAQQLAVFRFLQAFGGGAAPVLARAVVGDLYSKEESARTLSLLMMVMSIAPMVAPVVGGVFLLVWSWRSIFWFLVLFGLVAAGGVLTIKESLPSERRAKGPLWHAFGVYGGLLRSRAFLPYMAAGAFQYAGMFAYISGTPFVYIEYFGVGAQAYGFFFALNVVGIMGVNLLNRRLVPRLGSDSALRLGARISAVSGVVLIVLGATGTFGFVGILVPMFVFVSMLGLVSPNAMAGGMALVPWAGGAASALAGAAQFAGGALAGLLVGRLADGTPVPLVAVVGAMGIGCWLSSLAVGCAARNP